MNSDEPDVPQPPDPRAANAPALTGPTVSVGWRAGRRFGFRFLFCYVIVYSLPFPVGSLPWTEKARDLYRSLVAPIVVWIGEDVLRIGTPIATELNGSGDRTYDYVALLAQLTLAVGLAAVWSLVDRRRAHPRMLEWLRFYARVLLATTMVAYGVAKLLESQFMSPSAAQLLQTYGDSSPMNLLWTFMGFSRPYRIFAGVMEVLPGLLLLSRRTAGAGALVLLGVMGNVVVLNLCYDVPVKLYSSHLWLLSLFVAWPSIGRLVRALIFNRPVAPEPRPRLLASRRARQIAAPVYVLFLLLLGFEIVLPRLERYRSADDEHNPVRGTFEVEEMIADGKVLPPGDTGRWSRIWIRRRGVWIYWPDGRAQPYRSTREIDGPMTLDLSLWGDEAKRRRALLELRADGDQLVLDGEFESTKIRMRLGKVQVRDSLLMSRGFHWINEVPYNR